LEGREGDKGLKNPSGKMTQARRKGGPYKKKWGGGGTRGLKKGVDVKNSQRAFSKKVNRDKVTGFRGAWDHVTRGQKKRGSGLLKKMEGKSKQAGGHSGSFKKKNAGESTSSLKSHSKPKKSNACLKK